MKDAKIVRALNTVSPTDIQKKRMRAALEGRLRGAEREDFPNLTTMDFSMPENRPVKAPKEDRRPAKPKYQSAKPAKSRGTGLALLAAMFALVITGGLFLGVMKGKLEETPSYARPTAAPTTVPTTAVTENPETEDMPKAYQDVIVKYVTAVEENWNPAQCSEQGISILIPYVTSLEEIGYTLLDVDEDGARELLMTDGDLIYDLFDIGPDGEAFPVVTGMDRISYRLCKDGLIFCAGSSSAARTDYTFYRYGNNTLDKIVEVHYDGERDKNYPWFLGDDMMRLTSLEADQIISRDHPYVYLPYTTLSGQAPLPEEVPDGETLNRFALALSPLMGGDMSTMYQLYCFYDYDGDGDTDLLLGSGQSIYQVLEGNGPNLISLAQFNFSPSGATYPCEDHVMEFINYTQGYTMFTYRQFKDGQMGGVEAMVYTDGEKWYTQQDSREINISEAAANTVRSARKRVNLPWRRMAEFPVDIPDSGGVTLSPLFVNVFLPFANEGKEITAEEFKQELENNGLTYETGEGMYYVKDISRAAASLSAASMDTVNCMIYTIEGDYGRFVRAMIGETGEMVYYGGAYLHEYPVENLDQLQALILADNDTISLWRTAESYALDYFQKLGQQEREQLSKEQGREVYVIDYAYNIQSITGLNIWKQRYEETGSVEIDIGAYVDSPDSFSYLTMELQKEDGGWKVVDASLQK